MDGASLPVLYTVAWATARFSNKLSSRLSKNDAHIDEVGPRMSPCARFSSFTDVRASLSMLGPGRATEKPCWGRSSTPWIATVLSGDVEDMWMVKRITPFRISFASVLSRNGRSIATNAEADATRLHRCSSPSNNTDTGKWWDRIGTMFCWC